jgi:alkylation response protein AidB-like acyl-CoA dehydrogenase
VITRDDGTSVLRGVKTFCSGAGGLDRALVLARVTEPDGGERPGPPTAVWVALTHETATVDETWFAGAGLRSSVSHRVTFHDAPVLAVLGEPGWISAQPWFSRDALRTSATWAGIVDAAAEAALTELRARPSTGELEALAAGRVRTEQATVDLWQRRAADAMDAGDPQELRTASVQARAAIAAAATRLLDEAARACGSHPFATGGPLERARRDLEVFLLQHRLDPLVARDGAQALREAGR